MRLYEADGRVELMDALTSEQAAALLGIKRASLRGIESRILKKIRLRLAESSENTT